jgi:hypothetical protein
VRLIPTPSDVLNAGHALAASAAAVRDAVTAVADLAPRLHDALDRAGRLLDGADALRDGLATAGDLLERLTGEAATRRGSRVGELVDRLDVDAVVRRSSTAGQLLDRTDVNAVVARTATAGQVVEALAELLTPARRDVFSAVLDRLSALASDDRLLHDLRTLVERALGVLTPDRAQRLAALLDESERLVTGLRDGDLPSRHDLKQVPPDLRATLELLDDLHQVVTGMPGARRAQERGADPHPRL